MRMQRILPVAASYETIFPPASPAKSSLPAVYSACHCRCLPPVQGYDGRHAIFPGLVIDSANKNQRSQYGFILPPKPIAPRGRSPSGNTSRSVVLRPRTTDRIRRIKREAASRRAPLLRRYQRARHRRILANVADRLPLALNFFRPVRSLGELLVSRCSPVQPSST